MPHFCFDELMALLLMVPFMKYAINWIKGCKKTWQDRHKKPNCLHNKEHE